jgi:hypothetical protein
VLCYILDTNSRVSIKKNYPEIDFNSVEPRNICHSPHTPHQMNRNHISRHPMAISLIPIYQNDCIVIGYQDIAFVFHLEAYLANPNPTQQNDGEASPRTQQNATNVAFLRRGRASPQWNKIRVVASGDSTRDIKCHGVLIFLSNTSYSHNTSECVL